MKIYTNPQVALGIKEKDLNSLGDWSEVYPVLDGEICVGVVSAYGDVLAGEYNGEIFDDSRQAYVS